MIPDDCRYTTGHLWVRASGVDADVGVTDVLLARVGQLISVELPDSGDEIQKGLLFGELEGTDETYQLVLPAEAHIVEVNYEILWNHEKLVKHPYDDGWLMKVQAEDAADLENLLDAEAYKAHCREEARRKKER